MESDQETDLKREKKPEKAPHAEINISHEDLSDVSDLDESIGGQSYDSKPEKSDKDNRRENSDDCKGYDDVKKVIFYKFST